MVATHTKHASFTEIRDRLFALAKRELEDVGGLLTGKVSEQEVMMSVTERIWGPECDPTLFDRLAAQMEDELDEESYALLMSMRNGIADLFGLGHVGDEIVLFVPIFGFVARAIEGETPTLEDLARFVPAHGVRYVHATLLPQGDHLTYSYLQTYATIIAPNREIGFADKNACMLERDGRVVRTPAELAEAKRVQQESQVVYVNLYPPADEHEACDELGADQHPGKLAGLEWELRERLAAEHRTDERLDSALNDRTIVSAGTIPEDFDANGFDRAALMRTLRLDTLQDMCEANQIEVDADVWSDRDALSEVVAEKLPQGSTLTINDLIWSGEKAVRDVRRALEAGGCLRVPLSEVHTVSDVPHGCPLSSALFAGEDEFVLVVIKEVREMFQDLDWDEILQVATAVDAACARVATRCDFCGVVDVRDAMLGFLDIALSTPKHITMLEGVARRWLLPRQGAQFAQINDDCYLVHPLLAKDAGVDVWTHVPKNPYAITRILRSRGPIPARRYKEFEGFTDVASYVRSLEPWRKLTAYLDAHVPATQDDYRFADDVMDAYLEESRYHPNVRAFYHIIAEHDLTLTEAQRDQVDDLVRAVANKLPSWDYNGYSSLEVAEVVSTLAEDSCKDAEDEGDAGSGEDDDGNDAA